MTVSMRVMSAGDGYKYLLRTVAAADGNRPLSTPLTRYYMEEGTPPGRWLGAGVAALGKGEIQVGDRVSEHQLQLLMGTGCDPITGDKLGLGFPAYKSEYVNSTWPHHGGLSWPHLRGCVRGGSWWCRFR